MEKIVHIILDPYYEVATYVWGDAFAKYYQQILENRAKTYDDYVLVHLYKQDAVWSKFVAVLNQYKDQFIVDDGVAHGASDLKVGYMNTLMLACDDETAQIAPLIGLMKQTSCDIGQQLCPFLYQHGTKWTIGNTQPMYLVSGPDDEVKSFLLPEMESVTWLHDQFHSGAEIKAQDFYAKMLALYDQEIAKWDGSSVAYYLGINKKYRQLWDSGFILKKQVQPPPPPQPPKPAKKFKGSHSGELTGVAQGTIWIGRFKLAVTMRLDGVKYKGEEEGEIEEEE
jgi:hypothetical protein